MENDVKTPIDFLLESGVAESAAEALVLIAAGRVYFNGFQVPICDFDALYERPNEITVD